MENPEEFKRKMIKDLKWGLMGMGIVFLFTLIFLPALALAYNPIVKYYSSLEKEIIVSGIYVSAWTVFRLFHFVMEECKLYMDWPIKELLIITVRVIRKILILPVAVYIITFVMLYLMDHIRDEGLRTMVFIGCIYLWNYIFFHTADYLDKEITDINIK